MSIRGIGRVRARKLYDNGIKSTDDIRKSGLQRISDLIGPKTAAKLFREIGLHLDFKPEDSGKVNSQTMGTLMENEQSTFSDFEK
ncbi:MAG: helix-hairpin-helix domain-containing protein [Methanolobus sp.]